MGRARDKRVHRARVLKNVAGGNLHQHPGGQLEYAAGEENLLAAYLHHTNDRGEHDFCIPSGADGIYVEDGNFEKYVRSAEYKRKKHADRESYVWAYDL